MKKIQNSFFNDLKLIIIKKIESIIKNNDMIKSNNYFDEISVYSTEELLKKKLFKKYYSKIEKIKNDFKNRYFINKYLNTCLYIIYILINYLYQIIKIEQKNYYSLVLRFWDNDVFKNMNDVLQTIYNELEFSPSLRGNVNAVDKGELKNNKTSTSPSAKADTSPQSREGLITNRYN